MMNPFSEDGWLILMLAPVLAVTVIALFWDGPKKR